MTTPAFPTDALNSVLAYLGALSGNTISFTVTPVPAPAAPVTSADGSTLVDATGQIIDAIPVAWVLKAPPADRGLTGLGAYRDGKYEEGTQQVVLLLWYKKSIYRKEATGNWFVRVAGGWQPSADPRPAPVVAPAPAPAVVPAPTPTPAATTAATPPGPTSAPSKLLGGVNMAVAEFGGTVPGTMNKDYAYPSNSSFDAYLAAGMKLFRIPVRWERLQNVLNGPLVAADLAELDRVVSYVTGKGGTALIDVHNYMRCRVNGQDTLVANATGVTLGKDHLSDLWSKLATHYKGNASVWFGLMNEPHDMADDDLVGIHKAVIAAIGATGATNKVLVSSNGWDGASRFGDAAYAAKMLSLFDGSYPNLALEVHQYADSNYSGTPTNPVNTTAPAKDMMVGVTNAARAKGVTVYLTEFGGNATPEFQSAVTAQLDYMAANSDVWKGFTIWAGGPWWGSYGYYVGPTGAQMSWLAPYMVAA